MARATIVLAGATGDLGCRVARALIARGANVRAIVRRQSDRRKVAALRKHGADPVEVDFDSSSELKAACSGGACIVSALSGLRDVIVGTQTVLLDAAVEAGVPRFIPSDFALDFTKLPKGTNRNLDLRREFHERLDEAPIAATSILNGMFTELLTGQAPIVLFRFRRILYWGDADQLLDFTTRDDTAAFTAAAALDPSTPRFLRIAGDQQSARGLSKVATLVTGEEYRLLRAGELSTLDRLIRIARFIPSAGDALYPPWQGMQYTRDMFDGRGKLRPLDNDRYPGIRWTPVGDVLTQGLVQSVRPKATTRRWRALRGH